MTSPWPKAAYFNSGTAAARKFLAELSFVARDGWYELYQRKCDGSYWRLDADDKYQQRYLISIENLDSWQSFDASPLEKLLLLQGRGGLSTERCRWKSCQEFALIGSAFCVDHTYEMGVRK